MTDPLPEGFPPIDVRVSMPERMEPGVTLLEPVYSPMDGSTQEKQWLIAVDSAGAVVWYYEASHTFSDAQRLRNGNILYGSGDTSKYEIDMLGNQIAHWRSNLAPEDRIGPDSIHIATDTLHHEAFEMPNGNILALSTQLRVIEDFPTSETDPDAPTAASDVVSDVITEFTRAGEIVRQIPVLDLMDPWRIGYGAISNRYWYGVYADQSEAPRDWSHANGVSIDATGRYLLISFRHQSAVIKYDLEAEEIVWILGDHTDWDAQWQPFLLDPIDDDMLWQSEQHAPVYTPEGTILLFDNGTNRARPFDEPMAPEVSFSRAVEYQVDEENMTVEEVWSIGGPGDTERY